MGCRLCTPAAAVAAAASVATAAAAASAAAATGSAAGVADVSYSKSVAPPASIHPFHSFLSSLSASTHWAPKWHLLVSSLAGVLLGSTSLGRHKAHTKPCLSRALKAVNWTMAAVDLAIAIVAAAQLWRMWKNDPRRKWTREKVFHAMVFAANLTYAVYFLANPIASCAPLDCWSHICGFVASAVPQLLYLATFLLLLSFWIDLCHQATEDVDDEEEVVVESDGLRPRAESVSERILSIGSDRSNSTGSSLLASMKEPLLYSRSQSQNSRTTGPAAAAAAAVEAARTGSSSTTSRSDSWRLWPERQHSRMSCLSSSCIPEVHSDDAGSKPGTRTPPPRFSVGQTQDAPLGLPAAEPQARVPVYRTASSGASAAGASAGLKDLLGDESGSLLGGFQEGAGKGGGPYVLQSPMGRQPGIVSRSDSARLREPQPKEGKAGGGQQKAQGEGEARGMWVKEAAASEAKGKAQLTQWLLSIFGSSKGRTSWHPPKEVPSHSQSVKVTVHERRLSSTPNGSSGVVVRERRSLDGAEGSRRASGSSFTAPGGRLKVKDRHKIILGVVLFIAVLTLIFAVLIWATYGDSPVDASTMAQIHATFFAIATLLSGGCLAFYGLWLYSKMAKVRAAKRSSELGKVAWIALICLFCFTLRASLVLSIYFPEWMNLDFRDKHGRLRPLCFLAYYLIGESLPCAVVLYMLKDVNPPPKQPKAEAVPPLPPLTISSCPGLVRPSAESPFTLTPALSPSAHHAAVTAALLEYQQQMAIAPVLPQWVVPPRGAPYAVVPSPPPASIAAAASEAAAAAVAAAAAAATSTAASEQTLPGLQTSKSFSAVAGSGPALSSAGGNLRSLRFPSTPSPSFKLRSSRMDSHNSLQPLQEESSERSGH